MARSVIVLMAKDAVSVQALADKGDWKIYYPIRAFDDIVSDHHPDLGVDPGELLCKRKGHVALAYRDV